jgi:Bacterial protein of unknown function (DUF885)
MDFGTGLSPSATPQTTGSHWAPGCSPRWCARPNTSTCRSRGSRQPVRRTWRATLPQGLGNGNPENHVAQLTDALLRDVRLLSAIGLHTEGMTVAQSERLFREEAFLNPGGARQQAARGTYDPAYLNYTLGKLTIKKLRDDWVARQMAGKAGADPKTYWHDFHDQFLSYGGPPIPLVRRAMLGENEGSLL